MKKILTTLLAGCCCHHLYAQNMIDNYLTGTPTYTVIAGSAQRVNQPRDLDFKPSTNELWIINRGSSAGGSNVIIYNAGESDQNIQFRQDTHTGHFMIYPSGIAFGDNSNFANTNEIKNTADPSSTFMGPTLWTADTSIFARVFQNNWANPKPLGSHLDMLHQSPFSMGIAHDSANMYWVFDGHNGNLCKYDFAEDHSPGYDDHSNGRIWRYTDVPLTRVANVPGHLVKDKTTGWLYMIDAGTKKLKRLNTNTGSITGTLNVPSTSGEGLNGYWAVTGATVQTLDSFTTSQPCGVDVYNGRLLVSDYANGNIYVYDVTGASPVRLGTIATGQTGIMGIKIGADGRIWFVNYTQNTVVRINPATGINNDIDVVAITSPALNNADPNFYHTAFNHCSGTVSPVITIRNTGLNTLTAATIRYRLDNTLHTHNWTGSLAAGATASVTLPAITAAAGTHKLEVEAVSPNGNTDSNPANNKKMGSFRVMASAAAYPFSETFATATFPPAGWSVIGHNIYNKMERIAAVNGFGSTMGTGAVRMENVSAYEDISGQNDYLLTPRINMSNAGGDAVLTFSVAYAQRIASANERLTIKASKDCGQTWSTIYDKAGSALATAGITGSAFVPTGSQWRREVVLVSAYAGEPGVIFQFQATSASGNNLFLDDISIASGTGIAGQQQPLLRIYPNPTQNIVTVDGLNKINEAATISVYDVTGKLVATQHIDRSTEKATVDLSAHASGTYLIRIKSGDYQYQEKVTLTK